MGLLSVLSDACRLRCNRVPEPGDEVLERLKDERALRARPYSVAGAKFVGAVPGRREAGWQATVLLRRGTCRTLSVFMSGCTIDFGRLGTGRLASSDDVG